MAQEKKKSFLITVVLFAVVLGAGGVAYVVRQNQVTEQLAEEQRQARALANKEYEDILNDFVQQIAAEVKAYKAQRSVIRELARPVNFEKPEYAKENFEELRDRVQPALREQAVKVLNVFNIVSTKIDDVLKSKSEDTRLFISTKWMAMREREQSKYKAFFDADAKVLTAYEELLKFYVSKAGAYKIENEAFVFNDPSDQQAEQELLGIIASMQTGGDKSGPEPAAGVVETVPEAPPQTPPQ